MMGPAPGRSLLLACALSLAAATGVAVARSIEGRVATKAGDPSNIRVTVNGGERVTFVRSDGRFAVDGLAPGVYLLELSPLSVGEHALQFSTYKVQVPEHGGDIVVLEYRYPGAPKLTVRHPIEVAPVAPAAFFEERPRPSVWTFVANPTILMMIVMGGMVFVMPMLMVSQGGALPMSAAGKSGAVRGLPVYCDFPALWRLPV